MSMIDNLKVPIILLLGLFICFQNWSAMYSSFTKDTAHSPVPFLGGLLLCFGISIIKAIQQYWWVGLLIDPTIFIIWIIYFFKKINN